MWSFFERQRLERLFYSWDLLLIGTWLFSENLTALEGQVVVVQGCAEKVCRAIALGEKRKKGGGVNKKKQGAHVLGFVWGKLHLAAKRQCLQLRDAPGGAPAWVPR